MTEYDFFYALAVVFNVVIVVLMSVGSAVLFKLLRSKRF